MVRHDLSENDFDRRLYEDGLTDSICLHCFTTVASAPHEKHLVREEAEHDCWMRQQAAMKTLL